MPPEERAKEIAGPRRAEFIDAVAAEREACAVIAETTVGAYDRRWRCNNPATPSEIAAAIRARGNKIGWGDCENEWSELTDPRHHFDFATEVACKKCSCPGSKNNKTGRVFWPTD